MRGEMNSLAATSLLPTPSLTSRTTSSSVGVSEASWNAAGKTPAILTAWDALDVYVDDMLARRRHTLTDDLISDLIRAEDDGDRLSAGELRMLVAALLLAGTDTTRLQLGAATQVLCEHPDQWDLLGQHPELAINAVEELIRHSPITFITLRAAVEDVELADVKIAAGTLVSSSSTPGRPTAIPLSATIPTV